MCEDKALGYATGFFYRDSRENLYLGTNKHVLFSDQDETIPDTMNLYLHNDLKNSSYKVYSVQLFSAAGDAQWIEHPEDKDIDLILIPLIEKSVEKNYIIEAWSKHTTLPSEYTLYTDQSVSVIGFPFNLFDKKKYLPVYLNAKISSVYTRGYPYFLIEADLPTGASGSPVIIEYGGSSLKTIENEKEINEISWKIIGIYSSTFYLDTDDGNEESLGLGITWYIHHIEKIVNSL